MMCLRGRGWDEGEGLDLGVLFRGLCGWVSVVVCLWWGLCEMSG